VRVWRGCQVGLALSVQCHVLKSRRCFSIPGTAKNDLPRQWADRQEPLFQNVMLALGNEWLTYIPANQDETRTTAGSKGKV
jgi:hypothetical protein